MALDAVLKTVRCKSRVGSTPTPSAKKLGVAQWDRAPASKPEVVGSSPTTLQGKRITRACSKRFENAGRVIEAGGLHPAVGNYNLQ